MYTGSALYTTETDYRVETRARTRLSEVAGSQPESILPLSALSCSNCFTLLPQRPHRIFTRSTICLGLNNTILFGYSGPFPVFSSKYFVQKSKLLGQAIDVILNFAVLSDGLLQFLP